MKTLTLFAAVLTTGMAMPALAQDATDHANHAMDAAPENAAPPSATAASAAPVTDAEVDSFAAAAVEIQKIEADASIPAEAKQTQMASKVSEHGLTPQRFNEISTQTQTDVELQQRVQLAMSELISPAG